MANSSDEGLNSDDEVIDLKPLWNDHPFLSGSNSEEPKEQFADEEDLETIELPDPPTPIEVINPLQSLMDEIRVINRRAARQRLINQGFLPLDEEEFSYNPVRVTYDTFAQSYNTSDAGPSSQPDDYDLRPRLVAHRRRFSGIHSSTPQRSRLPLSSLPPTYNEAFEVYNSSGVEFTADIKQENYRDNKFLLPKVLEEKEHEGQLDEAARAERIHFATELIYSSMVGEYIPQKNYGTFPRRDKENLKTKKSM